MYLYLGYISKVSSPTLLWWLDASSKVWTFWAVEDLKNLENGRIVVTNHFFGRIMTHQESSNNDSSIDSISYPQEGEERARLGQQVAPLDTEPGRLRDLYPGRISLMKGWN